MGCGASKNHDTATADNKKAAKAKTAAEHKVAWSTIQKRLPRTRSAEDKARRITLFEQFDKEDHGHITQEEAYVGCRDVLKLNEFTIRLRDIVKRAFDKASSMGNKAEGAGSADFVEFLEFRLFLCYIYDYFELTVMFDEIDTTGNMLIDQKEFHAAVPKLAEWGVTVRDPDAVFKSIDTNGSGNITFDEFAEWATSQKLEADRDHSDLVSVPAAAAAPAEAASYPGQEAPALEALEGTARPDSYPAPEAAAPALAATEAAEGGYPGQEAPAAFATEGPADEAPREAAAAPSGRHAPAEERTAAERKVAWDRIRARLPRERTPEAKAERIELFKQFDRRQERALTEEDVQVGSRDVLGLQDFTSRVTDIVRRAFNKASSMGTQVEGAGDADKVEFLEFRLFLCYIYDYFELTVMFDEIDTSGDMMVDREEFRAAVPKIAEWGLQIRDADAVFNKIDDNGSGKITFDEFAAWASAKKLDADKQENVE